LASWSVVTCFFIRKNNRSEVTAMYRKPLTVCKLVNTCLSLMMESKKVSDKKIQRIPRIKYNKVILYSNLTFLYSGFTFCIISDFNNRVKIT